jgi:hypothetical protein
MMWEEADTNIVKLLKSHKEGLSNEWSVQLHEEFGLVPKDPEADICDEDALLQDLTKDVII